MIGIRRWPGLAGCLVAAALAICAGSSSARQVLFVSSEGSNTVGEYASANGVAINPAFINRSQGLNSPDSLAVDGNNHLFVANYNGGTANAIGQYDATTGATINAHFAPTGYTFSFTTDGHNRLYVPSYFSGVFVYDSTSGAALNSPLFGYLGGVEGVAVDRTNNAFGLNYNGGTVGRYDATTGTAINTSLVSGLFFPSAIVADARNHLFVAHGTQSTNTYNDTIGVFDATTGAPINGNFISMPGGVGSMAVDDANHLFVVNSSSTVAEYDATTGALINPAFIRGLNNASGLAYMSPVPEPSSLLLVTAAAAIAGRFRRRLS